MNWTHDLIMTMMSILGGGILSIFLSLISNRKMKLTYEISTFNLISKKVNNISGLEIKYNSFPIERLYSSTITITNTSNRRINSTDIASKRPLCIITPGKFIITDNNELISVLAKQEYDVKLQPEIDTNNICSKILINFDYIPAKEKMSFSLLHTDEISVNGTIKDGNIINTKKNNHSKKLLLNYKTIYLYFIILFLVFLIIRTYTSWSNYKKYMDNTINHIYQNLDEINYNNDNLNDDVDSIMKQLQYMKEYNNSYGVGAADTPKI